MTAGLGKHRFRSWLASLSARRSADRRCPACRRTCRGAITGDISCFRHVLNRRKIVYEMRLGLSFKKFLFSDFDSGISFTGFENGSLLSWWRIGQINPTGIRLSSHFFILGYRYDCPGERCRFGKSIQRKKHAPDKSKSTQVPFHSKFLHAASTFRSARRWQNVRDIRARGAYARLMIASPATRPTANFADDFMMHSLNERVESGI